MRDPSQEETLPKALWVWDNAARFSLPRGLMIWLAALVVTVLCSAFFLSAHVPARWVLGGFIVSHVVVFGAGATRFIVRRGFVSLMHVLCWLPGLVLVAFDSTGRTANQVYEIWSWCLVGILSISLLFDFRDGATFLFYLFRGRLPRNSGADPN